MPDSYNRGKIGVVVEFILKKYPWALQNLRKVKPPVKADRHESFLARLVEAAKMGPPAPSPPSMRIIFTEKWSSPTPPSMSKLFTEDWSS